MLKKTEVFFDERDVTFKGPKMHYSLSVREVFRRYIFGVLREIDLQIRDARLVILLPTIFFA